MNTAPIVSKDRGPETREQKSRISDCIAQNGNRARRQLLE